MREFQFKYYVLNYDFNKKKVVLFNIFDNIHVQEWTEKAIKQYLRSPSKYKYEHSFINRKTVYGFEALCEEVKSIIQWQEWGRRQYEISVGDAFEDNCDRLEKWDCYMQCEKNIEMITRECLWQYRKWLKEVKVKENDMRSKENIHY